MTTDLTQEDFWREIYEANTKEKAKRLARSIRILIIDIEDEAKQEVKNQIKKALGIDD